MLILRILFWAVELTLIFGVFSYCFYITGLFLSRFFEVPFVPTNREAIQKVFSLIKPKSGHRLIELGCGDGRVICSVVKQYDLHGRGIDKNPIFIVVARIRAFLMGVSGKISFKQDDVRDADLGWADIIYLFMIPKFIHGEDMKNKILTEARKGTYIISHWYQIEYLKEKEIHRVQTGSHITYVYRI
jgi:hypothetical protein